MDRHRHQATHRANMDWVTVDLAVGGDLAFDPAIAARQVADILGQGVTHIIDLRIEADDADIWDGTGVRYVWVGTDDREGHRIGAEVFDQGVGIAREALAAGGKVLAHCHMGINRGPSMGFAILLDRGLRAVEAFDLIRAKRTVAAVYYADDALEAHCARRAREGRPLPQAERERRALARHMDRVLTSAEVDRINHIIRGNAAGT